MTKRKTHLTILIIGLFLTGLSLFLYRHWVLGVPFTPQETVKSWTVEANLKFSAKPEVPIKASFIIPYMPPNYATLDEYFVSYNYGVSTQVENDNRQTIWSIRRAQGAQSLYYRAIYRKTNEEGRKLSSPGPITKKELKESEQAAVEVITSQARKSSADIQTFAQETLKALQKSNGNTKVLLHDQTTPEALVNAAVVVLNQAKIHARPVKLLKFSAQNKGTFITWLNVYNEKEWLFINPETATTGLNDDYLVWQYGDAPLYAVGGGINPQFNISITPTPVSALSVAKIRGTQTASNLIKFSLLQLPLDVQQTYKILLTVPIGAFLILILRNFVGLMTFGTFMPVLIALAFRQTHVIAGITLFSLIVAMGLLVRFYLDQLRLLLVPRLATILTAVILLMMIISILCQHLGIEKGLSVALFPMVILTMVIERMCITWDERGPSDAILAGIGSLVAAVVTYIPMNDPYIEYLMFAFPELLLVVCALILWFGQYRGYRLFELLRFRSLVKK